MDWSLLKKFKNQFNLAKDAAASLSQKNIGLNISGSTGQAVEFKLDIPPANEIARFAAVTRSLIDPASVLYYKGIASMLCDSHLISPSHRELLEKDIAAFEAGPIQITLNEEKLRAVDLYDIYARGEFFEEHEVSADKLKEYRLSPFIPQYVIYTFYAYCFDVFRVCNYLYDVIREAETTLPEAELPDINLHQCIYCLTTEGSFKSEEHIFPESLGNTEFVLSPGNVCDKCNNEILSRLDAYLVEHDAIAFLRVLFVPYNTKTGKFPKARYQNISIEKTRPRLIEFKEPNSARKAFITKPGGDGINITINTTGRVKFDPVMLGRSLYKIALGLVCMKHGQQVALESRYDIAREFILGRRLFPNNLLIKRTGVPTPMIKSEHYLWTPGTPFFISIFGVDFAFNLEPEPIMPSNAVSINENIQIFSLSGD